MQTPTELSRSQAARLALHHQGLGRRDAFGRGRGAALKAIRQLGYVQIDTISVIERAHHHVLKSRVSNYQPEMLDRLTRERKLFEYWFHAAACLPMENYRFFLPVMQRHRDRTLKNRVSPKLEKAVLRRIQAEGPLGAKDFTDEPGPAVPGGWWNWKPAKMALERLFFCGRLMVASRKGFQKIYDLPERILPQDIDTRMPSAEEWADYLLDTMLNAAGLAGFAEITYLRSTQNRALHPPAWMHAVQTRLTERLADGEITELKLDGQPHFAKTASLNALPARLGQRPVTILSPFDNLIIQRKRTKKLFDFDYQLECYVPAPKRRFGYFSLPLLQKGRLIGQTDLKADRARGVLQVRQLHLLPRHMQQKDAVLDALQDFARWHGCEGLEIDIFPGKSKT